MPHDSGEGHMRVLYGLETVRLRPEMYAGPLDRPGLANQLLVDVLCEAADLHDLGAAFGVTVTLGADAHVCIEDDGPGWSVAPTFEGPAAAEMMMTNLFGWERGGEWRPSYDLSTMGLPVLNALSAWAELTIWRDGHTYHQRYECGSPMQRLRACGQSV
ncbi:MAG: hypothetical protein AAF624_03410 [Bacteroidota bacterium]